MPREVDDSAQHARADGEVAHAVLLGRDHTGPGAMATARADVRTAVGIARGWRPKPYAYVDPNEDAVAAAADDVAQLLVVADGHNGHRASHVAVATVLDLLGAEPPTELDDDDLVEVFTEVEREIAEAAPPFGPRARTTLIVALRTPQDLTWAGAGDSALLVVGAGVTASLPAQTRWFCGDHLSTAELREALARGRTDLPGHAWVALATDGYTDYLPVPRPPAEATQAFLRGLSDAEQAADALMRQARRGGAGDNVGVSVSRPW
ncbi:MAG TPA: protein phosphatase 2C domain-containing protein [Euzebyales bacterium]|nr:protein phosphatase 2C domain-containing protein [Euzebyales bacterium]